MTLDQGFAYLESFANLERRPDPSLRSYRLDRMLRMTQEFGSPEKSFQAIHVAGSKGKGSTSAFLAGGLTALGYKPGLYTSPHLRSYTERITLAGSPWEDRIYLQALQELRTWVDGGGRDLLEREYGEPPTTFELLTLLAFLVFREARVDWGVIEVGLGGRLDATNILSPRACVLTPIELEHTDLLGTTLEAIAGEKGGIIKPRIPVWCAPQPRQAYEVFHRLCAERQAPLTYLPETLNYLQTEPLPRGTRTRWAFSGTPEKILDLRMAGEVMGWNAVLAYRVLTDLLPGSQEPVLRRGIGGVTLPGRMEFMNLTPEVLLDGAHTRRSCEELVKNLEFYLPGPRTLLFGAVEGKDWGGMAEVLSPAFDQVIITTPGTFKKSDPQALWEVFKTFHPRCTLIKDPREAWEMARGHGRPVVVCGSFYLVAQVQGLAEG